MPENEVQHKTSGRRKSADDSDDLELEMEDESQIESISINMPSETTEKVSDTSIDPHANDLDYRATESPKLSTALLLGFQQVMTCISGILVIPNIVAQISCAGAATIALRVQLISTTLVLTGITTLLQTTFGLRLAILQGPSFAFIPPLLAFNELPGQKCNFSMTDEVPEEFYLNRIRTIQGSLALGGILLAMVGATGLIGTISKRISPLVIVPVMILLCLGNAPLVVEKSETHWISVFQFALLLCFALFLTDVSIPIPYFNRSGFHTLKYRLFGHFPYLISIVISCILASILTATDFEPYGGYARVDNNQSVAVLTSSPWVQVPYPGQFGWPKFSVGLFLGICASCVACMVESVGAYQTLARVSLEKPPNLSVLNRAIFVEGVGCFLGGLMGTGVGVTTYSENVAVVSITRIASRFTMQIAGVMLILLGLFTKFGALLASIPDPIVGGTLAIGVCMIAGVCLSNLQSVNLKLSRNLTVIGIAIIMGVCIPDYFSKHPVTTGVTEVDQMFNILLQIKMFVGGIIAFLLDNVSPGATKEDRGLSAHSVDNNTGSDSDSSSGSINSKYLNEHLSGYAFHPKINEFLLRFRLSTTLPFMPSEDRLKASCMSLDKTNNNEKDVSSVPNGDEKKVPVV